MEKLALLIKNYAWSCVDSCSGYKYRKIETKPHFKVVMYSCKLFAGNLFFGQGILRFC